MSRATRLSFEKQISLTGLVVAAALLASSCSSSSSSSTGGSSTPSGTTTAGSSAASTSAQGSGPAAAMAASCGGTEQDWQKLISAAQQEGKLSITGPPDPKVSGPLPAAFKSAFGISVDYTGGGGKVAAKVKTERAAGVYSKDVMLGGANTMYTVVAKSGWLDDLASTFVSPTLSQSSTWVGGKVPFMDPGHKTIIELATSVIPQLTINTDQVKSKTLGLKDLLDPKWRGKMVMVDPTTGAGTQFNVAIQMDDTNGDAYLQKLFKDQKLTFTSDPKMAAEDVAKGQYAIGIGVDQQAADVAGLVQDGLPVDAIRASDVPPLVSGGWSLMGLLTKAPHPNAAKLFVNWMACPTGNKEWIAVQPGSLSTRADVRKGQAAPPAYAQIDPSKPYWDTYSWDLVTGPKADDTLKLVKSLVKS